MNFPLLALFTRSLREDAHGAATYWARAALATFILLVLAGMAATKSWIGAPGKNFFIGIVSLQAISITLVGLSYFGSAITEEKEEQTLGLLRMTDLNPLSILLGKSTSRLGGALLLLAAQFPFTIFAVTLGGVSLGQITATYCTLGAYTFLLCNVALLGSVIARRTAGASTFTLLVMGTLLAAGPLLGAWNQRLLQHGVDLGLKPLADTLWKASPLARLIEILGTGFSGSPAGWQVASNLALGVVFFMAAWAAFGRFCDRVPVEGGNAVASKKMLGLSLRRPPRPQAYALIWKDFYFLGGGRLGLIVRIVGYGGSAIFAGIGALKGNGPAGFTAAGSLVTFVFSIDLAVLAARMFGTEIRDQTLSALAMLPLNIRQIAYRKALALLHVALPGAIAVLICGILTITSFSGALRSSSAPTPSLVAMLVSQTIANLVNIILLVHVVAWLSLIMKRGAVPVGYVATQAFHTIIAVGGMALAAALGSFRGGNMAFLSYSQFVGVGASIIAIVILHRRGLRRLEALVGES